MQERARSSLLLMSMIEEVGKAGKTIIVHAVSMRS